MNCLNNDYFKKTDEYIRLFNLSTDILCVIHFSGYLFDINPACKKVLGYSQNELINKNMMLFIHPEDLKSAKDSFKCLFQGNFLNGVEYRFLCKDGSYKCLQLNASPSLDHKLIYAVGRDITEEKKMKKEIKELTADYETIFNGTQDALFLVDITEDNKFYYKKLNSSAYIALDVIGENIIGKSPVEVFGEVNGEIINNHYLDCIKSGSKITYEQSEWHIKHNKIWNTVLNPIIKCGKIVKIVGSSTDITEKKQIEAFQKETDEKIRTLNESIHYENLKSEFFSNLSHELRTPLNVIFSSLQLVELHSEMNINLKKDDKLNRYLKVMKQNCFRLLRLINNLIDITKIDSGYYDLVLENKNIVSIIEDICLSVADYIEDKSIEFIFDTTIEEKFMAIDSDKIERVILNLLSNSIKFTNPGGKIIVNLSEEEDMLIISIKDTGTGIPKDKLDFIFDRFRQVDKSLTRNHEGSGIGLSLVKSLVNLHKGTIYAESTYGEGSEFIIQLPILKTSDNTQVSSDNNCIKSSSVERINIEFSDIYS